MYGKRLSILVSILPILLLPACGTPKKPPLTPEQKVQMEQQRLEQQKISKARKIREARQLGLLEMTPNQKMAFMKGFLSRLRAKQVSKGCDIVNDVAYYSKQFYLARCKNGYEFFVSVSKNGDELLAFQKQFGPRLGIYFDLGVWFIGEHEYPE